jgi:beta-lactamase regulating signal transducer with metallopeptidase domain
MQALFSHLPGLLKMSGQASILIMLVLAAQWFCGRRLQPRWRCALWLLVLLRLALPWTIPSPASLFNVLKFPAAARPAPPETAPALMMDAPIPQATSVAVAVPSTNGSGYWLAWLWAAGALGLAGCAAVNHYKIHRGVTRRRPLIDGPTLNLLEDCKLLMGVRTPVTLIETEAVESPALFGFVRPRLLLPAGLASGFTREELRHVFLHELAHIKRHDILVGWLTLGLQAIHWFNPLVWLAFHRLRADRELACDALVLSCTRAGENEFYGLTIVKLLEGFGQSGWAPSRAGILENKQQMKERITMIAKFDKTNRGLALALTLFAGLALVTLTDAQNQTQPQPAKIGEPDASKGVWVVRFEPVGDFSPRTPGEFLARIHVYSGQDGEIGYFRTKKQGDKLAGSFLAYDPDQLKAALAALPGIKVTSVEKLTQEQLTDYENSPQESLIDFNHLDASNGVWAVRFEPTGDFSPRTPGEFLARIHVYSGQDGEIGYFRTKKQGDKLVGSFLAYDPDQLKAALAALPGIKVSFVDKLTQEELIEYEKSPQESLTATDGDNWNLQEKLKMAEAGDQFAPYELWDAYSRGKHGIQPDPVQADKWLKQFVQDVWVVRFKPVDGFAPTGSGEFLARINQHFPPRSGKPGIMVSGFFRTTQQGDKLVGAFLSGDPDELKAGLANVPGVKVVSSERITPEQFIKYEQSPQESLKSP